MKNALGSSLNDFAQHIMKKKKRGYNNKLYILSEEVVSTHKILNAPMEVKVQHTQECYQQLPVLKENETSCRKHIL